MSDIEKAQRAIWHVRQLLEQNKDPYAIKLMEMAYQCNTTEAADFVRTVNSCMRYGELR